MQPKGRKNLLFWIVLIFSSANWCCLRTDATVAANSNTYNRKYQFSSKKPSFGSASVANQAYQKHEQQTLRDEGQRHTWVDKSTIASPTQILNFPTFSDYCKIYVCNNSSKSLNLQAESFPNEQPPTPPTFQSNNLLQLEAQPIHLPTVAPTVKEKKLDVAQINYAERINRLRRRLQNKQQSVADSNTNNEELGILRVRQKPLEQLPPPQPQQPASTFKPIGYLLARLGYMHTNNIFSSEVDQIKDGLIFSGLTLASAPLPLANKTYLNGSIDGNLIRYVDKSDFNYSQVRFNLGISRQLSSRMYGEIGWSNQQLFYTRNSELFDAGDRFLNENSLRLSLGRRDPLTQRLMLDSFYEFRLSLADPDNRDRLINSLWISLNYYLQKSLQVGLDYQFNLSDFTQRQREDQYHRMLTHITYGISDYSNISLQGGLTLGGSTEKNINFDGWFFTLNYNLDLGHF